MKMKRIIWIDWAKVILIYLMVVGHLFPADMLYRLIYAFHMPAFFIVSGYLYHEHDWKKILKSFGIPLIVFSFVNFVIWFVPKWLKGTLELSHLAERILVPYFGGPTTELDYIILFPGCWFVFALLLGRFLMGDIKCFSFVRNYALYAIGILCLLMAVEPFLFPDNVLVEYKFQRVIPSLPFLLFGYYIKNRLKMEKIGKIHFLVLFSIFVVAGTLQGDCNILNYKFGFSYILYYIIAISGSLCLFKLCTKFKSSQVIQVLSKGTLFVLAFNFSLIVCCRFVLIKMGLESFVTDKIIYPWVAGLFIMFVSYFPIKWLLKHYPVLLGK